MAGLVIYTFVLIVRFSIDCERDKAEREKKRKDYIDRNEDTVFNVYMGQKPAAHCRWFWHISCWRWACVMVQNLGRALGLVAVALTNFENGR